MKEHKFYQLAKEAKTNKTSSFSSKREFSAAGPCSLEDFIPTEWTWLFLNAKNIYIPVIVLNHEYVANFGSR